MIPRIRLLLFVFLSCGLLVTAADLGAQCTPAEIDCNQNGLEDSCDLSFGTSDDCNLNGIPDECDVASGVSQDCNLNSIPDECEPIGERILAPDGVSTSFGSAVDIHGDLAIVGDPRFEGDFLFPLNNGGAWVYSRQGTSWQLEARLLPSDLTEGLFFGSSVAIRGDYAVVGAPGAGTAAAPGSGAVYVFQNVQGTWTQVDKLDRVNAGVGDALGSAVALTNSQIMAGAPEAMTAGINSGVVAVYTLSNNAWLQTDTLAPVLPENGSRYGLHLDANGGRLAVGAPRDTAGVVNQAGAVYVYNQLGLSWSLQNKLTAPIPDGGADFGASAALSSDATRILIGAPRGNNGEGAAFVYALNGASFTYQRSLLAVGGTGNNDEFGTATGTAGGYDLVGAAGAGGDVGQLHVFDDMGTQVQLIVGSGANGGSQFGAATAGEGLFGVVGAPGMNLAFTYQVVPFIDCNDNDQDDVCEITTGLVADCNGNSIPDDCDLADGTASDCNGNSIPDSCEVADGTELDCNLNGVLDSCELAAGAADCNLNGIPDDCDLDCDESGTPDDCEIAADPSLDCNGNALLDQCDLVTGFAIDCNGNAVPDSCDLEINGGLSIDFNGNSIPDECDISSGLELDCNGNGRIDPQDLSDGTSLDCNLTGVPDECEIATGFSFDCNGNGTPDECEQSDGSAFDCNANGVLDQCDIAAGTSPDCNANGIPDECDVLGASLDCDGNGVPDECDLAAGLTPDPNGPTYIGVPADMTLLADAGACQTTASWDAPTVTDDCGVAFSSSSHPSGATFPVGMTQVSFTAIDVSGNQTTETFTVTVLDDQTPTITGLPVDIAVTTDLGACGAIVTWIEPSATDNCAVDTLTADATPGDFFPTGSTLISYTATDIHGNSLTESFTVEVTDAEAPVLVDLPADLVLENDAGSCSAIATWIEPTSTDNCGINVLTSDASPGDSFPVGETTVEYTTTDVFGNLTFGSFTVTVNDTEAPSIAGTPADITQTSDAGLCTAIVTWVEPTSADNCGVASLGPDLAPGTAFAVGTTTVTYTTADIHGNSATSSFTVTVTDDEAPMITDLPADLTIGSDAGQCGAVATWAEPGSTDNCAIDTLTSDAASGDFFAVGTTTVTYTTTDIHGNSAQATFTVTVNDTEAPAIVDLPADISLTSEAGLCGAAATWLAPTSTDNCAIATLTADAASGDFFPVGTSTVTYTTTDIHGNSTTASFAINVSDDEAPVIVDLPADIALENDLGLCGAVATWTAPSSTDNCAIATLTADAASGDLFPVGETTVTYTTTDLSGNSTTASFTVTVSDSEAPAIVGLPADIALENDLGLCGAVATWAEPSSTDNCAIATLTADAASGDLFPVGMSTVTYTT
ncbi:MAG: HYR domain-containing protein, partial [Planctomycetota bacterium]